MRAIDADALKKSVLDLHDCYNDFSDTYDKACIIGVIDEQPTIEPEQKTICKGCIHDNEWTHICKDCSRLYVDRYEGGAE